MQIVDLTYVELFSIVHSTSHLLILQYYYNLIPYILLKSLTDYLFYFIENYIINNVYPITY